MLDFTLKAYKQYLLAIKNKNIPFLLFRDFLAMQEKPLQFCLIRHDIDRKPKNALKMALLENKIGVKATYYFRTKSHTFKPEIIKKIESLGHEIGYHYESLSDTNGNIDLAIKDFTANLTKLRKVANIQTCAMHGQPLKKYDNRDIWKIKENENILKKELNIVGEVYLDIDYSNIAYINDTGRNWQSTKNNIRDKVNSKINTDFKNKEELLIFVKSKNNLKMIFQIHPERWADNYFNYFFILLWDTFINFIKLVLRIFRKLKLL